MKVQSYVSGFCAGRPVSASDSVVSDKLILLAELKPSVQSAILIFIVNNPSLFDTTLEINLKFDDDN